MRNRDFVREIGSKGKSSESLGGALDRLKNSFCVDLDDLLRDDVFVLVNDFEAHGVFEGYNAELFAHGCLGLVDHVSLFDQQEILDNLKRSLDCLDLDTEVLELIDFAWVHVGVHASQPDVAGSLDSGLGWHLDDLCLDFLLEFNVVGFSEDKPDFSVDKWGKFGELWLGLKLLKIFLVLFVL